MKISQHFIEAFKKSLISMPAFKPNTLGLMPYQMEILTGPKCFEWLEPDELKRIYARHDGVMLKLKIDLDAKFKLKPIPCEKSNPNPINK